MDQFIRSWFCRGVAWTLIPALVLTSVPAAAWDKPPAERAVNVPRDPAPPPPPKVKVNRTPPKVKPAPLYPVFSEDPTDNEIFKARVFSEPLVPLGSTSPEENRALARAITAYLEGRKTEDPAVLEAFLKDHPRSAWRASLLMNLGLVWRRLAYFTRAERSLREAWALAKDATDTRGRATADRALASLLELHMAFGRVEPLEELLAQVQSRDVLGSAADRVLDARGTAQVLRKHHHLAYPSGPIALQHVLHRLRPGEPPNKTLAGFHADADGATLAEMQDLARKVGMRLQMAFRPAGLDVAPDGTPLSLQIPTPSLIHLEAGHFAALVEVRNDRVRLEDPFLGGEVWMRRAALEEEASGYFLVPEGPLPEGWRPAARRETESVRGKCKVILPLKEATGCSDVQTGGNGGNCTGSSCSRMAAYSFHTLLVSLHVTDSPVGYSPPRGPAVEFQVTYNQREATQPAIFYFGNLGTRWTFDWQSWIEDDPTDPFQPVTVVKRGGGEETSKGSDGVTYQPSLHSRAVVVRTQSSPIRYERRLPDGSVEVFAQPDGAMTSPRRVFLTEIRDPQGNALGLTYDSELRLVSLTDAIGQVTTLSYELVDDPLKITKVTDPFGRQATLNYDGSGRLVRITDVIGIVSELEYGSGDFVSALTTPYGTTRFSWGTGDPYYAAQDRWLQATDPLGGTERLEYLYGYPSTVVAQPTDPPETVPAGFTSQNTGLNMGVFYFWDKRAQALYPGDHSKAWITRFLMADTLNISGMIQSEKAPLENRVWYFQDGELLTNGVGSHGRPTRIARVLDDGQSQITRHEYNSKGYVTRLVDPVGGETVYQYDTNEVDLLVVKHKNGSNYEPVVGYTYNPLHLRLTETDASGQTFSYTYNDRGQRTTVTTPARPGITEDRTTSYSYDGSGYLLSITGPGSAATTTFTYDGQGRTRTVTDPAGYTVTYDYDALDRPIRTTFPDGTYTEIVYNRLDPEKHRDPLGGWSHSIHDALRRPISVQDAAGRSTNLKWCPCGSLDKFVDPMGNETTWERDVQGRVTREVRADGSAVQYTYEATTSRIKTIKDAKNQETHYGYSLDDELEAVSYINAQVPTPSVTFSYDSYGRLSTMTDGVGTTTYTYHPITSPPTLGAGQLAAVDGPLGNDVITHGYDELGRPATRTLGGVTTTWSYDALGRLAAQIEAIGVFTYAYQGTTEDLTSLTYPNGQTTSYTYHPIEQDGWIQEIHHRASATGPTLSRFGYTYDAAGRVKTVTEEYAGEPGRVYEYEYCVFRAILNADSGGS